MSTDESTPQAQPTTEQSRAHAEPFARLDTNAGTLTVSCLLCGASTVVEAPGIVVPAADPTITDEDDPRLDITDDNPDMTRLVAEALNKGVVNLAGQPCSAPCPDCNGTGIRVMMGHYKVDNRVVWGPIEVPCLLCVGKGRLTIAMIDGINAAANRADQLRSDRRQRGESMMAAAIRLGMGIAEYSAAERARAL